MRPWAIRYATVEQLDAMATACWLPSRQTDGRTLNVRTFTADSPRHVSVYRTIHSPVRPEGMRNVLS